MENQTENPEDVDRLLSEARRALQDFEDGVDRKRLLLRLRTASPAHPVLLARFLFGGLGVLCVIAAIVVMAITQVNNDLARELAKFEMVIPYVPEEIPALPALLGVLALCMAVAWVMATFAALSLGRDATMLPWEQKQHQKLVNEVTRLTTQKAVMERIRSTPAGARPRIATPVPVSARRQTPGPTGSALSRGSFSRSTPSGAPGYAAGGAQGHAAPPGPKATPGGSLSYTTGQLPAVTATPYGAPSSGGGGFGPSPGGFGARGGGLGARAAVANPSGPAGTGAGGFAPVSKALEPSGYSNPGAPPEAPIGYESSNGSAGHAWSEGPDDVDDLQPEPEPAPAPGQRGGVRLGARPAPSAKASPLTASPSGRASPLTASPSGRASPLTASPSGRASPLTASPSGRASASGGARLGGRPAPPVPDDLADLVEVSHHEDTGPTEEEPTSSYDDDPSGASTAPPPKPQGGILGRARAGAANLRSTPYGSAGRVRPPPSSPPQTSSAGPEHTHPLAGGEKSPATRGGTPLGAAPKAGMSVAKGAPRLSAPLGFPGTPDRADRRNADESGAPKLPGGMFGTPAPIARNSRPPISVAAAVEVEDEVSVMEEEEDAPTARTTATANTETIVRKLPTFGPIEDDWLNEALQKAESLLRSFPMQAYLEFNQEPNLPFTLVIARATPAMAVRAMVNFVEFLAGIATPVRARIELVNVAHLDRSFHKNVEAALEPYFGGNVEIEPNPGRVDIRFTDPDPQWGAWPQLPIVEE